MRETADFINKLDRLSKALKTLPDKMAIEAVNFSKERFRMKNWVDTSREPWPARKRKSRGTLMVVSGRLKRSIRKLYASQEQILLGTDAPQAQILNDGGKITETVTVRKHLRDIKRTRNPRKVEVKSHTRKMNLTLPPRKFLGQSAVLMRRLERLVLKEFKRSLNGKI